MAGLYVAVAVAVAVAVVVSGTWTRLAVVGALPGLSGSMVRLALSAATGLSVASAGVVAAARLAAAVLSEERPFKAKLLSPPGSWARAALSFVFTKKTFDNVFAQAIVDMRDEHFEALAEGRPWKARWIVLAYYINLVLTVSAWFGTYVLQTVVGLWKIGL